MYVYLCVCVLLLPWKISRRIYKKLLMIKDKYQEITSYHYLHEHSLSFKILMNKKILVHLGCYLRHNSGNITSLPEY